MKNWLNHLHAWSLDLTNTKKGAFTLFIMAFADASFLPLPITTFFLVLVLLNTSKACKYSLFITIGTLAGALTGYAVGHLAWVTNSGEFTGLAKFFFNNIPGISLDLYNKIGILYRSRGFWILSLSAATPVPYGIFSITSGVFNLNIFVFCLSTLLSQGIKFYFLALISVKLGHIVKKLMDFNWKPVAFITMLGILITIAVMNAIHIIGRF
jgi:membrane protein YqaA with SNARE-associated domain